MKAGTDLKQLKVALVHDYLNDFGGAERVLMTLTQMFPQAPIYTAFVNRHGSAYAKFQHKQIIAWRFQSLINRYNLHSPFRFLIPYIWDSFDFSEYNLVISSASGYITKGIITPPDCLHVCYCHTPPRFLYGYPTARNWQKLWPVKLYAHWLIPRLRQYDFWAAQRPDVLVANSKTVQRRIAKFYRRPSTVIYPPVNLSEITAASQHYPDKQDYYLIVSRLVGAKGIRLAVEAARRLKFELKIAGEGKPLAHSPPNVSWLGRVPDQQLWQLYAQAKGFLALAQEEDFGMTVVEALAAGTPVIAYRSGGFVETVTPRTGVFFAQYTVDSLAQALKTFEQKKWSAKACQTQAQKFGSHQFVSQLTKLIQQQLSCRQDKSQKNKVY